MWHTTGLWGRTGVGQGPGSTSSKVSVVRREPLVVLLTGSACGQCWWRVCLHGAMHVTTCLPPPLPRATPQVRGKQQVVELGGKEALAEEEEEDGGQEEEEEEDGQQGRAQKRQRLDREGAGGSGSQDGEEEEGARRRATGAAAGASGRGPAAAAAAGRKRPAEELEKGAGGGGAGEQEEEEDDFLVVKKRDVFAEGVPEPGGLRGGEGGREGGRAVALGRGVLALRACCTETPRSDGWRWNECRQRGPLSTHGGMAFCFAHSVYGALSTVMPQSCLLPRQRTGKRKRRRSRRSRSGRPAGTAWSLTRR